MIPSRQFWLVFASLFLAITMTILPAAAQQQQRRPNILVIMGDDVGWFNIGAYHRGIMSGKTPNLDKLASEGMCSRTTTPKPAARQACEFHHRRIADPHRHDDRRTGRRRRGYPGAGLTLATALKRRAMPPGSSAKTTSAT